MIFSNCPQGLFIGQYYPSRVMRAHGKSAALCSEWGKNEPPESWRKWNCPEWRFEVKIDHSLWFLCFLNPVFKVYLALQIHTCTLEVRMEEGPLMTNAWLCLNGSLSWLLSGSRCHAWNVCPCLSHPSPNTACV